MYSTYSTSLLSNPRVAASDDDSLSPKVRNVCAIPVRFRREDLAERAYTTFGHGVGRFAKWRHVEEGVVC